MGYKILIIIGMILCRKLFIIWINAWNSYIFFLYVQQIFSLYIWNPDWWTLLGIKIRLNSPWHLFHLFYPGLLAFFVFSIQSCLSLVWLTPCILMLTSDYTKSFSSLRTELGACYFLLRCLEFTCLRHSTLSAAKSQSIKKTNELYLNFIFYFFSL